MKSSFRLPPSITTLSLAALTMLFLTAGCAQFSPFGTPAADDPHVQRATAALKANDTVTAQSELDTFLRRDPNNAALIAGVADLCIRRQAWGLASQYAALGLQHAGQADKSVRLSLYTSASTAWYNLGKPDKAVEMAKAGFEVDTKDPAAMNLLGYTYAIIPVPDKLNEALSLTRAAVETAKEKDMPPEEMAMFLDSAGWAEYQLGAKDSGLYPKALADLERAANLLPGLWEVQYHVGMAAMKLQKYDEAVIALERATRLSPGTPAVEQALKEARRLAPAQPQPPANADTSSPPPPVTHNNTGLPASGP